MRTSTPVCSRAVTKASRGPLPEAVSSRRWPPSRRVTVRMESSSPAAVRVAPLSS